VIGRPSARARVVGVVCCLGLAIGFVYAPVRSHEFVNFDDAQYVSENSQVAGGLTWPGVRWAFTTTHAGNWHPLTWISHMLDVEVHGLDAGGHHVTSALIHLANALLLFGLFHRLTGAVGRCAFVAAGFALHPLHVESVAWVAERKDVLSAFFGLLTLHAYVHFVRRPTASRYLLIATGFACALMSKPMPVTLPFIMLLLDIWPLARVGLARSASDGTDARRSWRSLLVEKAPLFLMAAASSSVTLAVQHAAGAVRPLEALPAARRAANAALSYVSYVCAAVWPAGLAPLYPYPASIAAWKVVAAALALAAVTALAVRRAGRRPYVLVGWLWYLGMLVPVIGLVQVGSQPQADRYTYLPLVGLLVAMAWTVREGIAAAVPGRRGIRILAVLAASAAVTAWAVAARAQVLTWKDSVTLWEHTLRVTEDNHRAHNNLGHALARAGRTREAVAHYGEALRLRPGYPEAHNNLALALAGEGRLEDAIDHYRAALRGVPDYAEAHNNLGLALASQGRLDAAAAQLEQAVRVAPASPEAHNNLGSVLARRRQYDAAARHLREALRLAPDHAEAHENLALSLAEQGRASEAAGHYREALRSRPHSPRAHVGLGHLLVRQGQYAEAAAHYEAALRLAPDDAEAWNGAGVVRAEQADWPSAIERYRRAVQIRPDFAEAYSNLGTALANAGRETEALEAFSTAVRLRPDVADFHYDAGVMCARTGRVRDAVRHFENAVRLDARHENARRALAVLRERAG
jgi:Flp pilus assembly protein TadD